MLAAVSTVSSYPGQPQPGRTGTSPHHPIPQRPVGWGGAAVGMPPSSEEAFFRHALNKPPRDPATLRYSSLVVHYTQNTNKLARQPLSPPDTTLRTVAGPSPRVRGGVGLLPFPAIEPSNHRTSAAGTDADGWFANSDLAASLLAILPPSGHCSNVVPPPPAARARQLRKRCTTRCSNPATRHAGQAAAGRRCATRGGWPCPHPEA